MNVFKKTVVFLVLCSLARTLSAQAPPKVAEKDKVAYLFVSFTGNKIEEEAIRFAVVPMAIITLPSITTMR